MKNNWIENPTKTQILIVLCLYAVAMTLNVLAMTDLFTESPFQSKFTMMFLLIIGATFMVIKVLGNFLKTKK